MFIQMVNGSIERLEVNQAVKAPGHEENARSAAEFLCAQVTEKKLANRH
jgi:hypothetical protein